MMNAASCSVERCERPSVSRSLCRTCYQIAYRAGELYLYPTNDMINNPDDTLRAAFTYYPENIADIALEFGYELVKRELS